MSEVAPAPPGPAPAPASGGGGGGPMAVPLGLGATKGAGGAGGGGGGGGATKQEGNGKLIVDEDEPSTLGADRTATHSYDFALGKMTLQAALSHLGKNRDGVAPSISELSALKKLLNNHGFAYDGTGGGARVDQYAATEAVIEQIGELNGEHAPDLHLQRILGIGDEEYIEEVAPEPSKHPFNQSTLKPACPFPEIRLDPELEPTSPEEELRLQELITDPRSGFAPEGLDAYDLEHSQEILLMPSVAGRSDFTREDSNEGWLVVVLSPDDKNYSDLTRAVDGKMHIILNASAVPPTPSLVTAIRDVSKKYPGVYVHLSINN